MKPAYANRLWLLSARRAAKNFHTASHHVADAQSRLLHTCLERNKNAAYVSAHSSGLPLSTYDEYLPFIDRIANGEQNVLTAERVELFELSSGSTSASKMIPYTRTLKHEFGRGLSSWINDLYTRFPDLVTGPAYWSISPLTEGRRRTPAGIPIGFEEDSDYLGPLGTWIESALAVPNFVKHICDVKAFRYVTLLFLLRSADLRLISVWNPTFLTLLLAPLAEWWESLLRDLASGSITPPASIDEKLIDALQAKLKSNPQRARELSNLKPANYSSIWPHLQLISCWADGASAKYARDLQDQFAGVIIQPKGLLATEAFVSFPLTGQSGAALAVTSHYFEFLADGEIRLAHQLERGKQYSVVVTTGGGLYRYQLNDIVEVTDFYNDVPCFHFIGKADQVSDYFGEKLSEPFVAGVLNQLFNAHDLAPQFYMLAPEDAGEFHYTLYVELSQLPPGFAAELDSGLRANFHYDYCRKLGQLAETRTTLVTHGIESYNTACQLRGQKLGDIKPSILQKVADWDKFFRTVEPV